MLFVPFADVAMRTTFGQIEPVLEESARSLGAGALSTLWRVTVPLARPGLEIGVGVAVLKTSKHPEIADRFASFLVSPPAQRLIGQGDDFEYPARLGPGGVG